MKNLAALCKELHAVEIVIWLGVLMLGTWYLCRINDRMDYWITRANHFEKLAEAKQVMLDDAHFLHSGIINVMEEHFKVEHTRVVDVTSYSPRTSECDSDPYITAAMTRVRPGIVAVSRDLFNRGWSFGRKVHIEGLGIYTIEDLMNKRFTDRIDIFNGNTKAAKAFGKRKLKVTLLALE